MDLAGSRRTLLLVCGVAILGLALFAWPASPLSLTGEDAEPAQLSVSSFERLETGCADDVATYAHSGHGDGSYTRVSFVETGDETAALTARTERTSPAGAALRTFRVYVDAPGHSPGRTTDRSAASDTGRADGNASCKVGVQYRIDISYDRGSPRGFLSGDDGTRVLWLENGAYSGCSASTSGSLDAGCGRFTRASQSDRTWANATATG